MKIYIIIICTDRCYRMEEYITKQKFLCICDLLLVGKESITLEELKLWSDYIVETPIRALYSEGRKLHGKNIDVKGIAESIDISLIASYLNRQSEENLLGLGKIFKVLGKNSNVLLSNPKHGKLINNYIGLFASEA